MDELVARFRRAIRSRAFLLFLFFLSLLIVTVSIFVPSSNTESDGADSSDVYWYITIAIVAMVTLTFLISAFTCPSCMTPIRQESSYPPVVYHRNPERVAIGHDNLGADIEPELRSVERPGRPGIRESSNLESWETANNPVGRERSSSAPPNLTVQSRSASDAWSTPPPPYSSPSSSEMGEYVRARMRNEGPNYRRSSDASTPQLSRATGNVQRHQHRFVHPLLQAPESFQQYRPSITPPAPHSSPVSERDGEDQESVSLTTISTRMHSSSTGIDGNCRTSSSPTPCTGSTITLSSNSTSNTPEELPSGPELERRPPLVNDLPFYTGHAIAQSIAARQRISNQLHHGYTGEHKFRTAESSLQRWRDLNLPAGETLSDDGSIDASSTSGTAGAVQEDGEPAPQSHVTNPVQNDEEIAGLFDVTIQVQEDEVETELGLIMQMATSVWRAAWSSVNRWVQPATRAQSLSGADEASAENPETLETEPVAPTGSRFESHSPAHGTPQRTSGGQNSPGSPTRPAHTEVNMTSCARPEQEGEDVLPPEKRARQ